MTTSDTVTTNDTVTAPVTRITSAVMILPSEGLGGGIESYAEGVLGSLRGAGIDVEVLALLDSGRPRATTLDKVRFGVRAVRLGTGTSASSGLFLVLHPSFAVIAVIVDVMRRARPPRPTVFFYGIDIWACSRWQRALINRRRLPIATISSYSAGALAGSGLAVTTVIPPTMSRSRYESLIAISRVRTAADLMPAGILTVCRLDQAESKGVRTLIEATAVVRARYPTTRLVVAGRGPVPEWLVLEATRRPWLEIVQSPSPGELAEQYRAAALFVLATRSRCAAGSPLSGEGFGLVLAEAQLAGLPVISPARGGSDDAILEGITGLRPLDESVGSLASTIGSILNDPCRYASMSTNARVWARQAFAPERGVDSLVARLRGEGFAAPLDLLLQPRTRTPDGAATVSP